MAYPSFIVKAEELITSHIPDVSCECKDEITTRKDAIMLAIKTVITIRSVVPNQPQEIGWYGRDRTLRYWIFVEKQLQKKLKENGQ